MNENQMKSTFQFKKFPTAEISAIRNKERNTILLQGEGRIPLRIVCVHTVVGHTTKDNIEGGIKYTSTEHQPMILSDEEHFAALQSFCQGIAENLSEESVISQEQNEISNNLLYQIYKFVNNTHKNINLDTLEDDLLSIHYREILDQMDADWCIIALKFNNLKIDQIILDHVSSMNDEEKIRFISGYLTIRETPCVLCEWNEDNEEVEYTVYLRLELFDNKVLHERNNYFSNRVLDTRFENYNSLVSSILRSSFTDLEIKNENDNVYEISLTKNDYTLKIEVYASNNERVYECLINSIKIYHKSKFVCDLGNEQYHVYKINSEILKIVQAPVITQDDLLKIFFADYTQIWRGGSLG